MSILFNHFSVINFRVSAPEIDDFQMLVVSKQQLYEQIKNKLPEALSESSMLIRIVPRSVLSYGFESLVPTPMPTFVFGFLGITHTKVMNFRRDSGVLNMFHFPRIPPSPGLGIFFSQYHKKLTMTLSYIEDTVSEAEAEDLILTAAEQL